jgi:hypothetical protein
MSRRPAIAVAASLLAAASLAAGASRAATVTHGNAYARVTANGAAVGNKLIERAWAWDGAGFRTTSLKDKRTSREWIAQPGGSNEFTLTLGPVAITSAGWSVASAEAARIHPGPGVQLTMHLEGPLGLAIDRIARVRPGVAAVRVQTVLRTTAPLALESYTVDELAVSPGIGAAHAIGFNAGSDWHDYDYRKDFSGSTLDENAEWLDLDAGGEGTLGLLMERRNYVSSIMRYDGTRAAAIVDFSKDLLQLGPIEPFIVPNPTPVAVRHRTILPGRALPLEPAIVTLGTGQDDLLWQASRALEADTTGYQDSINFNTDKVHTPGIDVGARDGVNFAVFKNDLLPVAKAMGVERFVFDDGWQPFNGDWFPDPARYPPDPSEPANPLSGFNAVRTLLDQNGMQLGLWMAAGAFHPNGKTFGEHPEWGCVATGDATGAANLADPRGQLNNSAGAGIGLWNFDAPGANGVRYANKLRSDIDALVDAFDVREFKVDFLVWIDCANPPTEIYRHHDAFFEIVDSLVEEHPGVGFGIDETNDYRSFPFESILRGPTWFQNGNPDPDELLHNVWSLAPYVPGRAIGQQVRIEPGLPTQTIDERMAVALTYHMTFWTDIRALSGQTAILDRVKAWTDFAKAHRSLAHFAYPLLADPLAFKTAPTKWGALQPWSPAEEEGYLLLYRFEAPNPTQVVPLRGIPDGMTFSITNELAGTLLDSGQCSLPGGDTYTSQQLRDGIAATIAQTHGVCILRVQSV